ncbi:MAG TPA: polymer-forming cytoskeletal protein [Dongiaceae bacterium]|nr:polymer-forming cytoskeletal protein [Dongiaceae bacterium]
MSIVFSVLQAGLVIHGDIVVDHGVTILGYVDGDVTSTSGLVHVGPGGLVRGTVSGEHVVIDGTVEGSIAARRVLCINGRAKGDINYAGTLKLGNAASIEGQVTRVAAPSGAATVSIATDEATVTESVS